MDTPTDYRPVSPVAVAALLLGCCSAVALFTRFAWFVPLVGGVTAAAAVADVSRPASARAGRLPALAGLALSLGFGAQAVTDAAVGRWIERARAVTTAETWIDAIGRGRIDDALAASSAGILPAAEGSEPATPADRATRFAALPAVRLVGEGRPVVVSAAPLGTDDRAWVVRLAAADGRTLVLVAVPRMKASAQGPVERWTVVSAALES